MFLSFLTFQKIPFSDSDIEIEVPKEDDVEPDLPEWIQVNIINQLIQCCGVWILGSASVYTDPDPRIRIGKKRVRIWIQLWWTISGSFISPVTFFLVYNSVFLKRLLLYIINLIKKIKKKTIFCPLYFGCSALLPESVPNPFSTFLHNDADPDPAKWCWSGSTTLN